MYTHSLYWFGLALRHVVFNVEVDLEIVSCLFPVAFRRGHIFLSNIFFEIAEYFLHLAPKFRQFEVSSVLIRLIFVNVV